MKRRILGIALTLVLLLSLITGSVALAADPTGVVITWNGAGVVDGSVDTGDTLTSFHSEGTNHVGTFNATDSNNNPYNYGVDNNVASLETVITGSGWAELLVLRTDSHEPMYGASGQESYTYVGISSGVATLQNQSSTNYAAMGDANYGWNANDHITVTSADSYTLIRGIASGSGDVASVKATGTGDADLDCMSSSANSSSLKLGWGSGSYTNADFSATGTGTFTLAATGDTSTTTAMAPGMTGASSFSIIASWTSSFNVTDYSVTAN